MNPLIGNNTEKILREFYEKPSKENIFASYSDVSELVNILKFPKIQFNLPEIGKVGI